LIGRIEVVALNYIQGIPLAFNGQASHTDTTTRAIALNYSIFYFYTIYGHVISQNPAEVHFAGPPRNPLFILFYSFIWTWLLTGSTGDAAEALPLLIL
jgi:hypothetical protein